MKPVASVYVRCGDYRGWWAHLYDMADAPKWSAHRWLSANGEAVSYEVQTEHSA